MRRIRLTFANTNVEFVDRELAIKQVEEWAEKGTFPVQVVYGPEGCGKTAWLLQSVELLRELNFEVIYVNPINRLTMAEFGIEDLRNKFLKLVEEAISQNALVRIAWIAYNTAYELIKATRGKVAVIVDDAFQVIGVRESALYVKALLNLIEYPPEHYERIVTIVATSEGLSRWEIGRHRWADLTPMWNMAREGFRQLYEQVPGAKPPFEEAFRLTGGNPSMLARLYGESWDANLVVKRLIEEKKITPAFVTKWRNYLKNAIDDPDTLWRPDVPEELINELTKRNLILYFMQDRDARLWIDTPPPERDPELGIGRYVAWQSPLHREAVKVVLGGVG
ncbi:MAG: ATP-binding protein [Vulcanisaeta sp.]